MNSGSGYSVDSLVTAQDLAKYIEEKKTSHFSMDQLVSLVTQ
jgi:hypothetical protein